LFARDSAHQKLTRNLRAPQPKPSCYALAFVRARQRSPKAHPQSKGSAAKTKLLRSRFCFARDSAHQKLTRNLRAPQPKPSCYALAFASRATALTKSSPAI